MDQITAPWGQRTTLAQGAAWPARVHLQLERTRHYSLILAGSLFALVGAAYLLYATLRGELLPGPGHVSLIDAVRFQLTERAPSGVPWTPTA